MDSGRVTAQQFGYLVTFEMVTAMLCYIPVAHLADKYGRRPFVLITFVFFTLFPVTLLWAHNFAWLALAFVVRGLKEFGEPARKALIIGEAAPELRARTYGAYYLIRDCTVTSGSFLGAWLWYSQSAGEFHRRGHLRRAGNGLVLVVYLPENCLSTKNSFVARPHPDLLPLEQEQRLRVFCFANNRPANPAARISKDAANGKPSPWGEGWVREGSLLKYKIQICVFHHRTSSFSTVMEFAGSV